MSCVKGVSSLELMLLGISVSHLLWRRDECYLYPMLFNFVKEKKKKKLIKEKGSKTRKASMYHTVIRITEASEMSDVTQSFRFAHVLGIACL